MDPWSWWERIPVPPPTLAGVAAAWVLGRVHDVGRLPRWAAPAGWAVAAAGLVVVAGAVRDRGPGPLDAPADLVTTGMHARSRHPMYVGVTLVQVGLSGVTRVPRYW